MKNNIKYVLKEGIANACCIILAITLVALVIQTGLWWINPDPYNKVERIMTFICITGLGGPAIAGLSASFKWIWNHF